MLFSSLTKIDQWISQPYSRATLLWNEYWGNTVVFIHYSLLHFENFICRWNSCLFCWAAFIKMSPVVDWGEFRELCFFPQASSPHSQHPTVDVSQLHDPHGYSQHSIQVQHIQVTEPSGTGQGSTQVNPLSTEPAEPGVQLMSHRWITINDRKLVWLFLTSLSGHRSAFEPHLPAAQSGAEPDPADPCDLSSEPHSADQQQPAAAAADAAAAAGGNRAARIHTRELELQGLLWVTHAPMSSSEVW